MIDRFAHQGVLGKMQQLGFNLIEPSRCRTRAIERNVFRNRQQVFLGLAKSIDARHALALVLFGGQATL
jgi:hypothetical protein